MSTKKINIAIDAVNISLGGGATHIVELLNSVDTLPSEICGVYLFGRTEILSKIIFNPRIFTINIGVYQKNLFLRTFWQAFLLPHYLAKYKCKLLILPGGINYSNFINTISISQNLLPFESYERNRYKFSFFWIKLNLIFILQRFTFNKSKGIIFLSHYASQVITSSIRKHEGFTAVIPHGISDRFAMKSNNNNLIKSNSEIIKLLYVSSIDLYKHQLNVVKATARLIDSGFKVQLRLVGPIFRGIDPIFEFINTNDLYKASIEIVGPVASDLLVDEYRSANIFIFASSCENMPNILLEAMASGLPIVSSRNGPMPEILRDCGLYFNPECSDDIYSSLFKLVSSSDLQSKYSRAALLEASKYSWSKTSSDTLKFIVKVIQELE